METIIETERLLLRPTNAERDFDGWADMMSDADTMRYIGGVALNRSQAWRSMALMIGHWQIRGFGMFSITEKQSGKFIGRAGPWYPHGWEAPEVGWGLHRDYTGQGFAEEAARASLDFVFTELGWDSVIHYIDKDNHASMKLAEKLGSKNLKTVTSVGGVFEGEAFVYGQDRT